MEVERATLGEQRPRLGAVDGDHLEGIGGVGAMPQQVRQAAHPPAHFSFVDAGHQPFRRPNPQSVDPIALHRSERAGQGEPDGGTGLAHLFVGWLVQPERCDLADIGFCDIDGVRAVHSSH